MLRYRLVFGSFCLSAICLKIPWSLIYDLSNFRNFDEEWDKVAATDSAVSLDTSEIDIKVCFDFRGQLCI